MRTTICPRCNMQSLELLRSHVHCIACEYSPERNPEIRQWIETEYRNSKLAAHRRAEEVSPYHYLGLSRVL